MSQILSSLKVVSAKRVVATLDPIQFRRTKLLRKLEEQLKSARAEMNGETYNTKRTQIIKDKSTGEIQTVEKTTRFRPWWYTSQNGKICISLRYGSRVVDLAKGKNAIELTDKNELIPVMEKLKQAVEAGELDQQIGLAGDAVKARFKKSAKI